MNDKEIEQAFEVTDGFVVKSSDGGFMGIYSTVSLLNDKVKEIQKLQAQLSESQLANKGFIREIEELEAKLNEQERINREQFCKLVDAKEQLEEAEKLISAFEILVNGLRNVDDLVALMTSNKTVENIDFILEIIEKYKGGE
jgi:hypothetical protein